MTLRHSRAPSIRALTGIVVSLLATLPLQADEAPAEYAALKTQAEQFYAAKSYSLAHQFYLKADAWDLPAEEARWVDFRVADTLWRSQAGTDTADSTVYDTARQRLEALVRDIQRVEDRDRVWAEVQESLGDFWWARRDQRNWSQAWPHYQSALDWWAGTKDIELARTRYLAVVWTMAKPPQLEPYEDDYGYYGNIVPLEILENALKISGSETDNARAHYLIAMTLRQQGGDWTQQQRMLDEFEAAITPGKSTDWYDDALYHYAERLASSSARAIPLEDGQWRYEPDYVKALELFRRLVSEFAKGETRYYDQAKQQIDTITKPVVGVHVSNVFLPDSEVQFGLTWRNVKRVEYTLYKVDLTKDVRFPEKADAGDWIQHIELGWRQPVTSWSKETGDTGDYAPGQEAIRLESKLSPGAYVVVASAGAERARDLLLVSDASLIVKTSGRQALVYFCNALTSAPIARAALTVWERSYIGQAWVWRTSTKETNEDGLAVVDLQETQNRSELFVGAVSGDRQAFSLGSSYSYRRGDEPWRIYAFTDRPAYRPQDTVQWKLIARRDNGSVYSTPSHQVIEYQVNDPRGTKVKEGTLTLNAFGSAWDSLELGDSMPLGEYQVQCWTEGRKDGIGSATLFRLEEYKLPEFKVTVETPEVDGKQQTFRLGDRVEVSIQGDYYFGGPVANATVEVLVYQNPFHHWWYPPHEFPWFYEDMSPRHWYGGYGQGQIIKRETLKTDAAGKATLSFETPRGGQQDFEYRIEARVTDASRREIIGSDTVRVTRQRYYVYPRPAHNLYRPQDKVTVTIKALNANEQPVQAEGTVKVTRDYWFEIWVDPDGRDVKGEELQALRERHEVFPPTPPDPRKKGWRLKFQGYEHDDILTRTVKTDAEGEAEFSFTPEQEGYYRVAWSSPDKGSAPITGEATVWVATNATTELGYRHGGLEILVDKDTVRAGQAAPVMLVVPTNDRYVLFSVEGEDLYSYQLIHLTGTVKLLELPIEERHVPNIFLSAAMASDGQLFMDTKQVVVPPVQHFLQVDVQADREQYQPREDGTLTVTTRDHDGKPVSAEVALALVDESVYYIQQDYAPDPRQFYYGTKRQQHIQTHSTFQQKSYVKLVEGEEHQLIDERLLGLEKDESRDYHQRAGGGGLLERQSRHGLREYGYVLTGDKQDYAANGAFEEKAASGSGVAMGMVVAKTMPSAPASEEPRSGSEPSVQVRTDFRATIFWQPDVVTNQDGAATVKVTYPDSLTSWRATARVATEHNQFGIHTASTRTKQPLIVRLQAPRFFLVGDTVTISGVINNNTDQPMRVAASLNAEELTIMGLLTDEQLVKAQPTPVEVPANGEVRVDWLVAVQEAGEATLKVTARGGAYSDAMEKTYVVYEHGIEKFISKAGKVRGDGVTVTLDLPSARRPGSTSLTVQATSSLAVTMLDALPYLIDYPYGCTEQTMSRFLPAAITAKTLKDLGLRPDAVMDKVFGGIVQEHADKTHPKGKKDLKELDRMIKEGLDRLYDFQHSDGGWGWWKEGDSDHFMSAYVVWGLTLARDAGLRVKAGVLERGVTYLDKELVEEETSYDMQAWMLHALSAYHASQRRASVDQFQATAFENLWANREQLNAYTRALLALSAHHFGEVERAKTLIENLRNGVKTDATPDVSIVQEGVQQSHEAVMGTARWGEDGISWRWSEGGVEATAFTLRALLAIDPQSDLIEPVTNWLIKNRRGAQWSNTRDTAITVLTLNEYLRRSGELSPELEYELLVNGTSIAKKRVTSDDALSAPSQFVINPQLIKDGANEIRILRKSGTGPVYFAAQARFFSLEEPITPAGHEIYVRRQYYKLVGRPTLLKGYVYDKQPLNDGETVKSGERVEAGITIEAKNNYEYLVFEDLKPAGLEAVEIRSGESLYAKELKSGAVKRLFGDGQGTASGEAEMERRRMPTAETTLGVVPPPAGEEGTDYTGRTRWVYQELRDRKVALFIDKLPEGVWEIRYDLRAEVPGQFHALPVMGHAMYVPEIRCNGSEIRITVKDSQ